MKPTSNSFTIDVRRLHVLRLLRDHGTMAAAADALHISPSAVSQQLATLAREVGVPLFQHHGRKVTLTGEAWLLLDHADTLLAHLERVRTDLAAYLGGQTGEVRVGAFASAIVSLIAPALALLGRERPKLRLTVQEADAPQCLRLLDSGDLDLALTVDYRTGPARTDRRYHRTDLHRDRYDAVLPDGHRLAGAADLALDDLAAEPWIIAGGGGPCSEIPLTAAAEAGFTPRVAHRLNDYAAALALVGTGAGVAIIPRLAAVAPPPGVVLRRLRPHAPVRNIYAAGRAGTERDPRLQAVLAALGTVARRLGQNPNPVDAENSIVTVTRDISKDDVTLINRG